LIQELTSQGLNLEGVRRVLALQEENRMLKRKVDKLRDKLDDLEDEMEQRLNEVRRSYRHDIVLRSELRPVIGEDR
jgi:DNA-binding transcriptional MerR regulator